MAERKIAAAAMNIDLVSEVSHCHRRAFDMPARPPGPKARRPGRLVRPRTAPQREVQSVALGLGPNGAEQSFITQLANHRPARAMRQAPVPAIPARVEIEGVGLICVSGGMKARRRLEDSRN